MRNLVECPTQQFLKVFGLFCYFYFLKYKKKTVAYIRNGYSY